MQCGKDDINTINWVYYAKIIKVSQIPSGTPRANLKNDRKSMIALPWQKILLTDQKTNMPFVFYDYQGGLSQDYMEWCVKEFDFLKSHKFTLNQGSDALGADKSGIQWIQMIGIRYQGRNKSKPWDLKTNDFNENGDIDGYNPNFAESKMETLVELLCIQMHVLLPTACPRLVAELSQADIPGRLFNIRSLRPLSKDFLMNNIGVCVLRIPKSRTLRP